MRPCVLFVLGMSSLAFSQSTAVSGYAIDYVAAPGAYAAPFLPRLVTPEATFLTPPLQVGAENATAGNVAGAGNLISAQPVTNEDEDLAFPVFSTSSALQAQFEMSLSQVRAQADVFNSGAAIPQDAYGVAQLAGGRAANQPASRRFTNDDIQRMKDPVAR